MKDDSAPLSASPEILESRPIHSGRVFDLVHEHIRLPSGLEQRLDVVLHGGAVAIAARTAEGKLLCVRQYRHATKTTLVEIPAGRLEPNEDPASAARRELEEETGFRAGHWKFLGAFYAAPGFCSEQIHLFEATELELAGNERLAPDEDEELEVLELFPRELLAQSDLDAKTWIAAAQVLLQTP